MTVEKSVIRDSVRQVEKIYEQVSILIETADGLMKKHGWEPLASTVIRGSSQAYYLPKQWLPSVLTREYRNKKKINEVLLMGVVLDHDDIDEPLLVGTDMTLTDNEQEFPYATHDDSYFWFLKEGTSAGFVDVVVIDDPLKVYEKEKRELSSIKTFAVPLLEIKSSEELMSRFVTRLISLCS